MTAELEFDSDLPGGEPSTQREVALEPGVALRRARWLEERRVIGRIGRYTVLGQIAGGGMGSVFVAQMSGPAAFSRLVAIKCLHTRWLDDPKYVARFTTEVKLSTLIRHPNVVQTLDVVDEAGELFLVMEYVDGVTLAALLADLGRANRPLPVPIALGILSAVLRGLHAAHEAVDHDGAPCHIVHRDVSPQNIMLGRNGHVQVLDFGAAKAVEHSQHTAAGVLVGKLAYMAPEQVRGEGSGPRTDVFSAGVVLWESLVGQRLFYEPGLDRGDLLQALVLKPVPRPSRLRADVPPGVDEVVKRALSRNPQRRFQTALEFATALESIDATPTAAALAGLIAELCGERLAEKEALLRAGLAAAAEASASTPVPHALLVASPPSFSGVALASPATRQLRGSRMAWVGAALLAGSALWWTFDGPRSSRQRPVGALGTGVDSPSSGAHEGVGDRPRPLAARAPADTAEDDGATEREPTSPGRVRQAAVQQAAVQQAPVHDTLIAAAEQEQAMAAIPTLAPSDLSALSLAEPEPTRVERARSERSRAERPRARAERRRDVSDAVRPRMARARPAAQAAQPGGRDCDPPTYIDSAGIRHYKKDCL